MIYSKPRISGIQVDRLMRSEIKEFGTIVAEISSDICENPTYANPSYARFTVVIWIESNFFSIPTLIPKLPRNLVCNLRP